VRLARLAELPVRRLVDVAQIDGGPGLQEPLHDRRVEMPVSAQPLLTGGQRGGIGRVRHALLVVQPVLVHLEGRREVEDRLAVLDGDHPARGEGAAVADPVDRVDDGCAGIAGAQEVRVERVRGPVLGDRAPGGDERLGRDLPAEDPGDDGGPGPATEDVLLDLLQVEQIEEVL
jgi:hypothetical protein